MDLTIGLLGKITHKDLRGTDALTALSITIIQGNDKCRSIRATFGPAKTRVIYLSSQWSIISVCAHRYNIVNLFDTFN